MSELIAQNHMVLYVKNEAGDPIYHWITAQSQDTLTLVVSNADESEYEVSVKAYEWQNFCNGTSVERAFPDLTTGERQLILTGIPEII